MTLTKDNKVLTSENLYEYLGITEPTWAGVDFEFKFEDDLYTVIIDPNSSHPYYYKFKITTPAIDDWYMPDTLITGTIEDNLRRYKTSVIALKTFQNLQENLKHLNSPFGAHYDNDTVDVTFDGADYTIKVTNHGVVTYEPLDDEGQVVELGKSDSPEVVADKITDLILQGEYKQRGRTMIVTDKNASHVYDEFKAFVAQGVYNETSRMYDTKR